ncbi:30S ribosomal S17P protein [Fusarium beomiforme]|uniref:30S ribosomal S17P protein n=1 Tax=Fusarium beomiforme TaxID=44412 RepID=A0A9P5E0J0_9HYPO|nr:30S ribosomal S17P protein [Fusarium beomiforme]
MDDLDSFIDTAREIVRETPAVDLDRIIWLHELGNMLRRLFTSAGSLSDIEEAIQAVWKSNLGDHLGDRYLRTRDTKDLDEAVKLSREAANQLSPGHLDAPNLLNSLSIRLAHRYSKTRDNKDVEAGKQAIEAAEPGNPILAQYLSNLADCYWNHHALSACQDDFDDAITLYRAALDHPNSNTPSRIASGKALFETHTHASHWEQALEASETTFSLLLNLTPRFLSFVDKQRMLARVVDLACDTAAVALHAGKTPFYALNILDKGRGVLAVAIEQIRGDVLDLEESHPGLSHQFLQLRDVLDAPMESDDSASAQAVANRRAEATLELDNLIAEILKHPRFSSFLDSPCEEEFRAAASRGPVVVVNLSKFRCDAILIEQHQIRSLALPDLTIETLNEQGRQDLLSSPAMLKWFWDVAANPILYGLGIDGPPACDDWPHVWWIPTGRLSRLPFHAFGHHYPGSTETVLDRVVSSYSSSVQALINGRKRRHHCPSKGKALSIAMQDTIGQAKLSFAEEEHSQALKICKSINLEPCVPDRHKQAVLEGLKTCNIFHFVGHGNTDNSPSQSGLLLADGVLTVSELMDINLRKHAPFLAYLSACGTGRIGGNTFFDDHIHLFSACQLAGFRHVIGTLREVNDKSCVDVSRIVYETIKGQVFTDQSVCWSLHEATRELRDRWVNTSEQRLQRADPSDREGVWSRDIISCDVEEDKMEKLFWVPFVHFGV